MAAERKKSISVPQRSEERVMVFYWSVKLERERHWVRFGVLLGIRNAFRRTMNLYKIIISEMKMALLNYRLKSKGTLASYYFRHTQENLCCR